MRNSLMGLIALVGLMASGVTQAGVARCEGCTSGQFRARAISLGFGTHTITSLSTNTIKRFYVFDRNGDEPNTPTRVAATEMGVASDLRGIFAAAVGFYQVTNGTMHAVVEVRADRLGLAGAGDATVYDVMTDANLRSRLGDRLAHGQLPGVSSQLNLAGEKLVQGLFGYIGISDGSIEVTVRMKGGGIVVFELRANKGTGIYQEGRSRTSDGQLVPEANAKKYAGVWYGGGNHGYTGDLTQFSHYMQKLGATITGRGNGSATCIWNAPRLTCNLRPY